MTSTEMTAAVLRSAASFWDKSSGEFISSLMGALFGAAAAYVFQRRAETGKQRDSEHADILKVQLSLICMVNTLRNIQKQHLDKLRDDAQRELKLQLIWQAETPLEISVSSIAFLALKDQSNVILQVFVAARGYKSAIDAIRVRNEAFERLFRSAQIHAMDPITGKASISPNVLDLKIIKDATDTLFASVDDAEAKCRASVAALKHGARKALGKRKFLKFLSDEEASAMPGNVPM